MRVSAINNQKNANFEAKLNITGDPLLSYWNPKRLLPKNAIKRLADKAKTVGTDNDRIYISIWRGGVSEPIPNDFLNSFGFFNRRIKEVYTILSMFHCFPDKNSIDSASEIIIKGSEKERKISAYKTIWKYMDLLGEKFKNA